MNVNKRIRLVDITLLIYVITIFLYTDDTSTLYISNYAFILFAISVLLWVLICKEGKFSTANLKIYLPILLFSIITIPLAISTSLASEKTITLLTLIVLVALINNCFIQDGNPNFILFCVMIAGLAVSINIIREYGYANILAGLISGNRIGREVLQLSYLGRYAYMCAITAFYFAYYKKFRITYLFCAIGTLICFASQSRQSIITLIITFAILFLIKDFSKKKINNILKILAIIVVALIFIRLPALEAVWKRLFSGLMTINVNYGGSESDLKRVYMIQFGLETFLKNPVFGIGLGNIRCVVYGIISEYKYLHNNYVELLACGGIFGFVAYYLIYFKAFKNIKYHLKNTDFYRDEVAISLVLLIGQLVLDFFVVSYYSKLQYIIFAFVFIVISRCKESVESDSYDTKSDYKD